MCSVRAPIRSANCGHQLGTSTGSINWRGNINWVHQHDFDGQLGPSTGAINWVHQLIPNALSVNWVGQLDWPSTGSINWSHQLGPSTRAINWGHQLGPSTRAYGTRWCMVITPYCILACMAKRQTPPAVGQGRRPSTAFGGQALRGLRAGVTVLPTASSDIIRHQYTPPDTI